VLALCNLRVPLTLNNFGILEISFGTLGIYNITE
jgi:hypothetical protein